MDLVILALIASAYTPHPYSWRNGCDKAWRNVVRALGADVARREGVPRFEHSAN